MNPSGDTEKKDDALEKKPKARPSSANLRYNRQSSGNYDGDRYYRRSSRIIHNSNSGSVLNLSSVASADNQADKNFGARPKDIQPVIARGRRSDMKGSEETSEYKSQYKPKKTFWPYRKRTSSVKPTTEKSQRVQTRDNRAPLMDSIKNVKTEIDTVYTKPETRKPRHTTHEPEPCKQSRDPEGKNSMSENTTSQGSAKPDTKKGNEGRQRIPRQSKEKKIKEVKSKEHCELKKPRAKVTYLYIVINEDVSSSVDVKSFLVHRMGNPKGLQFELVDNRIDRKITNTGCSIINMKFESYNKASVARQFLHESNKHSSSKVRCFFERDMAEGQIVDKTMENKSKLENAFSEIVETATSVYEKHKTKILDWRSKLIAVEKVIGRKRGLSLYEFEKNSNEKLAFEDKLEELEKQQKEFRKYMDKMKVKLEMLIGCENFVKELTEIRKDFGIECRRLEAGLPMYARREDIITLIKGNQVCVILGETGSGKSTQMVQYIYQAGISAEGLIACTQPRKIAAINLATRVASELATSVGQEVGYKVGMKCKTSAVTKLLFMTDHILLNECLHDEYLTKYSCILIDEAHERSIYTDLLLGMLKKALNKRPDLKVIITSATIEPDTFVDYFGGVKFCPVMRVSGRMFPVDAFWEEESYFERSFPDDYESKALNKAIEIHQSEDIAAGDILVFLTSAVETERCCDRLTKKIGEADVQCLQLHGKLKTDEQQLVFKDTPKGKRKIVFATNSAETSITIPGIKFVVDSGVVKEMRFDPKKNMNTLDVVSVSQSSANQRKGRAGRTASGICFRLYTKTDFNGMNKMSSPEILRIQVSQALLKLMELGVDPMNFDYVQSPSNDAMQSAMCELIDLGAVSETGITDLGKWIAKLPVEPKLGVFVKRGIDIEIGSEALVVAACCNQTGIFFRVGSSEQKEASDMKKMKFCHLGGDLVTMLNVYREWDKVQERSKGRWCQNNSINGKAMKNIRDMTNEIITSIRKDLGIQIKHAFKSAEDTDELVQKLIFECMSSNLGYYLGHESAGYLIVDRLQRVKIHPSSAVVSLGFEPSWVVFNRVLKTSADYMTEITPVSNQMVQDALISGEICLDIESLESQTVKCVLKIPVGRHVYWKIVCSMHKMRRKIEEVVSNACDKSLIIVEADKLRSEISLFCLPPYKDQASTMLLSYLHSVQQQLLNECREEFIGSEESGVRAVLSLGGSAVDILMPDEFRSVNIKQNECSRCDLDEESLMERFEFYGPVEQIWRPTGKKQFNSPFWGKVTFTHEVDAVAAMDDINEDIGSDITLVPITFQNQKSNFKQGFTMKVTWCRRPTKGHCFVYLERPEDMAPLLGSTPIINGLPVVILPAKQQSDLFVRGLAYDATEEEVKEGLARELGVALSNCQQRFRVVIPRQNTIYVTGECLEKQEALFEIVSRYTTRDFFRVNVLGYSQKSVMVRAFVTFVDSQTCYDTAQQMIDDDPDIDGHDLCISLECKSTVHVNRRLYSLVADDIDDLVEVYKQKGSTTTFDIRHLKSGNISLDINAVSPQKLAKTKVRADRIVGGDILECGIKENLHAIFCNDGKKRVAGIEKTTRTLIFVDERQMKVTIQGRETGRIRAVQMIEDFIANQTASTEIEVRLKGEENPPGLLKALLIKYGIRFEHLKNDANISEIKLNLRKHEMTLIGTEDAVKLASDKIKELREQIAKPDTVIVTETELPDCPICLCPVDDNDVYRLEFCGHAYCKICVASQIQNAVSDRKMPIVCAVEECNQPFVIRDINVQIKMGNIKKKEFVGAALACLVAAKNESFRFCITPNCEVVYRTSSDGNRFICPVCHARICTACHIDFHDGLTCAMYKSAKTDGGSLERWMKENPMKRKMCPKCHLGIEKIDGCDHMECRCGVHICWKCLKYFPTSGKCYGHLSKVHASFV